MGPVSNPEKLGAAPSLVFLLLFFPTHYPRKVFQGLLSVANY